MIAKNPTPMPPSTFFADLIEKNREQQAEIDRVAAERDIAIAGVLAHKDEIDRLKGEILALRADVVRLRSFSD